MRSPIRPKRKKATPVVNKNVLACRRFVAFFCLGLCRLGYLFGSHLVDLGSDIDSRISSRFLGGIRATGRIGVGGIGRRECLIGYFDIC